MTYMRLTSRTLKDLTEMIEHLRGDVHELRLDVRHVQDQIRDYNTRLVNLTLRVDKCINQGE